MKFNVSSLLKETAGATRAYEIDEAVRIDGAQQHLTGHARFDRTPRGVLVRAQLSGETPETCGRCLKPLALTVPLTIEEEYLPTADVVTGAVIEVPEGEEDAYRINKQHMLDLTEPIEQYWSLALPMAPVCREDCPGLCLECGMELGDAGHQCSREQVDARWLKLQNLKLG